MNINVAWQIEIQVTNQYVMKEEEQWHENQFAPEKNDMWMKKCI